VPGTNVTVQVTLPTKESVVVSSTPDPERWNWWNVELSWTSIVYVPAGSVSMSRMSGKRRKMS
jgi:hypothetical protein